MFSVEGKSRKNPLYSLPGDLGVDEPHLELAGHDESDLGQPAGEGEEPDEVPRDVLALLALGPPAVINKQFSFVLISYNFDILLFTDLLSCSLTMLTVICSTISFISL